MSQVQQTSGFIIKQQYQFQNCQFLTPSPSSSFCKWSLFTKLSFAVTSKIISTTCEIGCSSGIAAACKNAPCTYLSLMKVDLVAKQFNRAVLATKPQARTAQTAQQAQLPAPAGAGKLNATQPTSSAAGRAIISVRQ